MEQLVAMALQEDMGPLGDITSQALCTDEHDTFLLTAKQEGVLCGCDVFREVFRQVDIDVTVNFHFSDGDTIPEGCTLATLTGKVLSILSAERTALNFISLLSGIATKARAFSSKTQGRSIILDTRKTIPGFRDLAKYAVLCGGAQNHRRGLYDMVLIKDNHIDAVGGVTTAVQRIRSIWGSRFHIEVEARTLKEVKEALSCKVDRIMLDNMDCSLMEDAVKLIGTAAEIEASGNMTLDRIEAVSQTGVDFISVGELTHSVKSLDLSLRRG